MESNTKAVVKTGFGGFLFGILLGTAAGVLFAPRSGTETRKLLHDGVLSVVSTAGEKVSGVQKAIGTKTSGIVKDVKELGHASTRGEEIEDLKNRIAQLESHAKRK